MSIAALAVVPAAPIPEAAANLDIFRAIILGMVQGLTEFIPISSTAHLKVVPVLLGWGDPGVAFSAVIQLGSIAAVFWYFWPDLTRLTRGAFKAVAEANYGDPDLRIVVGIVLGTVPIVICGLLIKLLIEDFDRSPLRSLVTIALASIVMSLLLAFTERVGRHKRTFEHLGAWDGIWMGLAQTLALIPGVSRSGSTLTAGLFIGLERPTAARFSFLLGLPAITLAGIVEMKDFIELGLRGSGLLPLIAGLISATIFSYAAIAWLIRYLQTHNTWVFVWYRLLFGGLILAGIASGTVDNF